MPTQPYKLADGTRVPGTTTILGRFKESGGLIHWAWTLGKEGKDYREVRDKAADAGTCAHDMVECDIRGLAFDATKYQADIVAKAEGAFGAYQEWRRQTQLEVVATEVAMVSEAHRYGGTLDAMLVQGKLSLGDWKTSNAIYPEYLGQLAAYGILWDERHPDNPVTGGFHLLRFNKPEHPDDPVQFAHHYWSQLDVAREAFLHMRTLYDLMNRLKKMT